uniref:Phorbol-ester/DAG-type domain-containing protein n=1 Tax=Macrostomum lignano TaxID=282301 RepID=A0A1I8HQ48_9PLAT
LRPYRLDLPVICCYRGVHLVHWRSATNYQRVPAWQPKSAVATGGHLNSRVLLVRHFSARFAGRDILFRQSLQCDSCWHLFGLHCQRYHICALVLRAGNYQHI